jgi:hypothetical protein
MSIPLGRTGSYNNIQIVYGKKAVPAGRLFLLGADGVTLYCHSTKLRVKQDSLEPEICFVTCTSLQGGLGITRYSAIAVTGDQENWRLAIFLGIGIDPNGSPRLHYSTWQVVSDLSPPPFFGTESEFVGSMLVQSMVLPRGDKLSCLFLTQVSGVRSGSRKLSHGFVNKKDGCVQCGKKRPDRLLHFPLTKKRWDGEQNSGALTTLDFAVGGMNEEVVSISSRRRRGGKQGRKQKAADIKPRRRVTVDHKPTKVISVRDHGKRIIVELQKKKVFTVPYLKSRGWFASITRDSLDELFSLNGQLTPEQHDAVLERLSVVSFCLYEHDTKEGPLRIAVVGAEAFDSDQTSSSEFGAVLLKVMDVYEGGNEGLPLGGVCISRWSTFPFDVSVSTKVADLLRHCYTDRGYGPRSFPHIGYCSFQGERSEKTRARTSVEQGPEEVGDFQLSRKTYTTPLIPFAEALTSVLSDQAMRAARWLTPEVVQFLESHLGPKYCLIKIASQGVPGVAFAYANGPHVDPDATSTDVSNNLRSSAASDEDFSRCEYLKRWLKLEGAPSVPTSCCWTLIGDFAVLGSEIEVFAYFVFETLGTAIRIRDNVGQVFFAAMAVHNTAVMVVVADGKVHYKSEGSFRMFAWGKGKAAKG